MKATQICIKKEDGQVMNTYRGFQEITNKHPDLYEWVDITKDGQPVDLPEWFIDPETTPAKWNGYALLLKN
jgi:predicted dithiol-disulfide oxidoreductase (DUF899 family)